MKPHTTNGWNESLSSPLMFRINYTSPGLHEILGTKEDSGDTSLTNTDSGKTILYFSIQVQFIFIYHSAMFFFLVITVLLGIQNLI